jgi:hypothetical protein
MAFKLFLGNNSMQCKPARRIKQVIDNDVGDNHLYLLVDTFAYPALVEIQHPNPVYSRSQVPYHCRPVHTRSLYVFAIKQNLIVFPAI